MTFEIIKGDLFDPSLNFSAIAQGVNCQGVMGAGIAVPFRNEYPKMYEEYKALCAKNKHLLPGTVHTYLVDVDDDRPDVFNMFTQFNPGANGDYGYLERAAYGVVQATDLIVKSMKLAASHFTTIPAGEPTLRIGLPWVGCGIAGLEKHNVEHLLRSQFEESHHQFVLVEQ